MDNSFFSDFRPDPPTATPVDDYWPTISRWTTWPLHMAVAWAAYPSPAEAVEQSQRPKSGPGHRDAAEAVRSALIEGRLIAYGIREPAEKWVPLEAQPHVEISSEEWKRLRWSGGTLCEAARLVGTGDALFLDVRIDRPSLLSIWRDVDTETRRSDQDFTSRQEEINAVAKALPADIRQVRGGRKGKPAAHPFWEALQTACGKDITRSEAELAFRVYKPTPKRGRPKKEAS